MSATEATLKRLDRQINRVIDAVTGPWWGWPATLVAIGALAFGVSLLFAPGPDEFTYVFGHRFGETCGFLTATGLPCPQCGMTRSWVHAARLDVVRSFFYNPAGATLFWWLIAGGAVGAVRLITRNPEALRVPHKLLAGWAIAWLVVIYALGWVSRAYLGINPLP